MRPVPWICVAVAAALATVEARADGDGLSANADRFAWAGFQSRIAFAPGAPGWRADFVPIRELGQLEPGLRLPATAVAAYYADEGWVDGPAMARALLERSNAELNASWSLLQGGQELFSLPRAAAFRTFVLGHVVHHRGQLSVYLRINDIAVPPIYGPTGDSAARR